MKEKLIASFQNLIDTVVATAPKVVVGLGLLIVALIVAKIVEKLLRLILVRMRFDSLVERAGVDKMLQRVGIRQQLNQFLPRLVYFLLLFLMAKTMADTLGWAAVSDALASFFAYLPNLIAALLLLVLGTAAAQFVGGTVSQAAESAGIEFAPTLGRVVSSLIIFIVGIMAMAQLKVDTEMIRLVSSFIMAGAAIAFGLSFGLGAREITRNVIAGFYARKLLEPGKALEVGEHRGTLRAITATHAILEAEDRNITITITVANGVFLDEVAKQ